jgi:DNA invertase Pin-like site-specific DNA recombinase
VSAYSGTPRKGYEALLGALKSQCAHALVCWHPDRLHRSPKELETFIDLIDATGVSVHSVTAGDFDLSTAEGRMLARITGSVARHESERKSERVRRAKQQEAAEGRFHGGGRPFGFLNDGVTLDPAEAELIRQAARKVVRGGSCRSIANGWNAAGILTPRGGRWVGQVVRRVLLSPRIRGFREHRGEIVGKGAWEAILDPESGASVEAVLLHRDRVTNGGVVGRRNYLAGYVFCGKCETRLFTSVVNKVPGMSCRKGSTPTGCGRLTVKTEPLDVMVRSIVVERLLMAPRTLALASEAGRDRPGSRKDLADELNDYRIRLAELEDQVVNGMIKPAQFGRLQSKIEERMGALMEQITASTEFDVIHDLPTTREALEAAWDAGDLDYRRALMGVVFERIVILPAEHRGKRFNAERVKPKFHDWSAARR